MILDQALKQKLVDILGAEALALSPLSAAAHARIFRVTLANKKNYVVKRSEAGLLQEAKMMETLVDLGKLPMPKIYYAADDLLIMEHIIADWHMDEPAQKDAACHLARLHQVTHDRYGYDFDTKLTGIFQPNKWMENWADFFITNRLLYMADMTYESGQIDTDLRKKIDKLAARLPEIIGSGNPPALIHGDCWGGNILAHRGKIKAFIDPAIYYADPEIELAFSTLFNTFDQSFFAQYAREKDIKPGFFEERRDIYNLYPLLVHTKLFGAGYARKVKRILERFA